MSLFEVSLFEVSLFEVSLFEVSLFEVNKRRRKGREFGKHVIRQIMASGRNLTKIKLKQTFATTLAVATTTPQQLQPKFCHFVTTATIFETYDRKEK